MPAHLLAIFASIAESAFVLALIGIPIALFFFFWIRSDLRASRREKAILLRRWQRGRPLHTITGWQLMPIKDRRRFRSPPPGLLITMTLIGIIPLALGKQWFGIIWIVYGVSILWPGAYVIPWLLSRKPPPLHQMPLTEEILDRVNKRINQRMEVSEIPRWVHHAWRNYQFTQFWLVLGLYGNFFAVMGILGGSVLRVLSGERGLRETLPTIGFACQVSFGLMALVLTVLLPIRFFSRWQMKRWDSEHSLSDQEIPRQEQQ